ncbi:hypothetical protein BpHYR1_047855, partial [Brachionus plicatilis]
SNRKLENPIEKRPEIFRNMINEVKKKNSTVLTFSYKILLKTVGLKMWSLFNFKNLVFVLCSKIHNVLIFCKISSHNENKKNHLFTDNFYRFSEVSININNNQQKLISNSYFKLKNTIN